MVMTSRGGIGTSFSWNAPFADITWSMNSKWIAFTAQAHNSFSQIYLVNVDRSDRIALHRITSSPSSSPTPVPAPPPTPAHAHAQVPDPHTHTHTHTRLTRTRT